VQRYPVRPSHRKNLDSAPLTVIVRTHFESAETDGESVTSSWGAIQRLSARGDKRELTVDVTMNPKVTEAVAAETIARYNRFLEEATGFNAKERAKRLRKLAKADPAED
jgi:hypothetical protein